ncbi:MAG: YfcE family phosphodiesterase [Defluviitaleaceae bacterium]|nr:YfcE family phosphodiesterase [Defluviitaleaceae bacterium]
MKKYLEKVWHVNKNASRKEIALERLSKQKETFLAFDEKVEVIIVSDNHGEKGGLQKVLKQHPNATHYFHCGDSNLAPDLPMMAPFVAVKGNTDYDQNYLEQEWRELASGDQLWMTHGHRYDVRSGTQTLVWNVGRERPKTPTHVILYGHTHIVDVKQESGVLIINPGSIWLPRGGSLIRTYAKLQITPEQYDVQIIDINDHSVVKEFQFPREWHPVDQVLK